MITLKHDLYTAIVLPELGMNTFSLDLGKGEILRKAPSVDVLKKDTNIYGIPMILPPGRIPSGKFSFEGRDYQMGINDMEDNTMIHGFLSRSAFTIDELTENSVRAHYENLGQILPFWFMMQVRFWLDDEGYHQHVEIENTGKINMPLAFGFHSCFKEPEYEKLPLCASMNRGKEVPIDDHGKMLRAGGKLNDEIDDSYKIDGHVAVIGDYDYVLSDTFEYMTVWNFDAKSSFVAFEPQQGVANCFNNGGGLKVLAPGEVKTYETLLRWHAASK